MKTQQVLASVFAWLSQNGGDPSELYGGLVAAAASNEGKLPEVEEGYYEMGRMLVKNASTKQTIPRRGSIKGHLEVGQVALDSVSKQVSNAIVKHTRVIQLDDEEESAG